MMVPIYLNHKDEKCANYKVSYTIGSVLHLDGALKTQFIFGQIKSTQLIQ